MFLILGLILTFLLGFFFTLLVAPKLTRLEQVALGWVIGIGFLTQEMFVLSILNINYSVISVVGSLFVSNLVLGFLVRGEINSLIRVRLSPAGLFSWVRYWFNELSTIDQILLILLVILVAGAFAKALYWPIYYWDALAWYDYRGKIFFEAGGIAKSAALASLNAHSYPPMTSLAHTLVYILGGKNANPQFIYPSFYLVLLVIFYISVRKYCQRWATLLFTFFLASIPFFVEFASNAYTNLPYAFFLGMGTVYLCRFMQEKDKGLLIISGLLLGLAGWTRSPTEQFFAINWVVLTMWCFRQRKFYFAPLVLLFLFVIFVVPWEGYVNYVLKIPPLSAPITEAVTSGIATSFDFERFLTVAKLLFQSIKGVSGTSLALALLVTVFFPRLAKKNVYLLMILFFNFVVFVFGSYALSLSWEGWRESILNSAHRLSMVFPPFVLYYAAISVPGFLRKDKK